MQDFHVTTYNDMREFNASNENLDLGNLSIPLIPKETFGLFLLIILGINLFTTVDLGPSKIEYPKEIVLGPHPDDGHYYGPLPSEYDQASVYNYEFKVKSGFFKSLEIWRAKEFSQRDFQNFILSSIPKKLRPRLKRYLPLALDVANKYQVDPFWVLAVMWTESHFNENAKSHVKARGLMQIMPGTSQYLAEILNMDFPRSRSQRVNFVLNVNTNIEMGVFYLKKLLRKFNGNYVYATVAYNMGPGWALRQIREKRPIGVRNNYLNKVTNAYNRLSKVFRQVLASRKAPYKNTFVYRFRDGAPVEKKFILFPHGLPVDVAANEDATVRDHILL